MSRAVCLCALAVFGVIAAVLPATVGASTTSAFRADIHDNFRTCPPGIDLCGKGVVHGYGTASPRPSKRRRRKVRRHEGDPECAPVAVESEYPLGRKERERSSGREWNRRLCRRDRERCDLGHDYRRAGPERHRTLRGDDHAALASRTNTSSNTAEPESRARGRRRRLH